MAVERRIGHLPVATREPTGRVPAPSMAGSVATTDVAAAHAVGSRVGAACAAAISGATADESSTASPHHRESSNPFSMPSCRVIFAAVEHPCRFV